MRKLYSMKIECSLGRCRVCKLYSIDIEWNLERCRVRKLYSMKIECSLGRCRVRKLYSIEIEWSLERCLVSEYMYGSLVFEMCFQLDMERYVRYFEVCCVWIWNNFSVKILHKRFISIRLRRKHIQLWDAVRLHIVAVIRTQWY